MKTNFEVEQEVECILIDKLPGVEVAPPLTLGKIYPIKAITLDKEGNQHLDVGLESVYNWITSHETGELLPDGDTIHWCHPSRFKLVEKNN